MINHIHIDSYENRKDIKEKCLSCLHNKLFSPKGSLEKALIHTIDKKAIFPRIVKMTVAMNTETLNPIGLGAIVSEDNNKEIFTIHCYVKKEYRGKKVGHDLIKHILIDNKRILVFRGGYAGSIAFWMKVGSTYGEVWGRTIHPLSKVKV